MFDKTIVVDLSADYRRAVYEKREEFTRNTDRFRRGNRRNKIGVRVNVIIPYVRVYGGAFLRFVSLLIIFKHETTETRTRCPNA